MLYIKQKEVQIQRAEPHGSAGSIAVLRTGGCWFDPQLGQYSFRGLMIVTVTGFIPPHHCPWFQ